jgi:hypothetical protein
MIEGRRVEIRMGVRDQGMTGSVTTNGLLTASKAPVNDELKV